MQTHPESSVQLFTSTHLKLHMLKTELSISSKPVFPATSPISVTSSSSLPVAQSKNPDVIIDSFLSHSTSNLTTNAAGSNSSKCTSNLVTTSHLHCFSWRVHHFVFFLLLYILQCILNTEADVSKNTSLLCTKSLLAFHLTQSKS